MQHILVNIDVPDVAKAVEFYTSAFELKVGRRFDNEFVELLGFPSPIYLLQKNAGTRPFDEATATRTYERHWSPIHFDVVVTSIEKSVALATTAGARIEHDIREAPYGKIAMLADPFGHGICLIEFGGRGYDELL